MNIENITNPIRKIEKYLGSKLTENNVEIVDNVIEVWNVDGKPMPTAEQLNSFDAEILADIQAEKDSISEKENLKASAKAKLVAGEPLTEAEADTLVI
jgi:hypothetical protein